MAATTVNATNATAVNDTNETTVNPNNAFLIPRMIEKKRDGGAFTNEEIEYLIQEVTTSRIQGTQLGALLMSVYLRGMTLSETTSLTAAMVRSGEVLTWPDEWRGLLADKHSTGGVGDKVSLPLAPALAACGLKVPMISGRGLGHTGGTLDKLESIPGFQVSQSRESMLSIMREVGCCIVGQTESIVPADKILYATRDVTGTVSSLPLIAASIISKKAAEQLTSLVLDVKTGKGAVMTNEQEARELAKTMVGISKGLGIKTKAVLTDMGNPIGRMVGNSLEVVEALDCLRGGGPEDLRELVTYLGGELMVLHNLAATVEEGKALICSKLDDGSALDTFRRMLVAQGVKEEDAGALCSPTGPAEDRAGDAGDNGERQVLPKAQHVTPVCAENTGYVSEIDSLTCARVSCAMGAGRAKWGDTIDYSVGLHFLVSAGSHVKKGDPWLLVHHNCSSLDPADLTSLSQSLTLTPAAPSSKHSRIKDVIG